MCIGSADLLGENCWISSPPPFTTANLLTKILDFRWFDSSGILILRGGIRMSKGTFPESLSQAIIVNETVRTDRILAACGVYTHICISIFAACGVYTHIQYMYTYTHIHTYMIAASWSEADRIWLSVDLRLWGLETGNKHSYIYIYKYRYISYYSIVYCIILYYIISCYNIFILYYIIL